MVPTEPQAPSPEASPSSQGQWGQVLALGFRWRVLRLTSPAQDEAAGGPWCPALSMRTGAGGDWASPSMCPARPAPPSLSPGSSEGSGERRVGRGPHSCLRHPRLAAPLLLATWPRHTVLCRLHLPWGGRGGVGEEPQGSIPPLVASLAPCPHVHPQSPSRPRLGVLFPPGPT